MTQELKVSVWAQVAWEQITCEGVAHQLISECWYLLAPTTGEALLILVLYF